MPGEAACAWPTRGFSASCRAWRPISSLYGLFPFSMCESDRRSDAPVFAAAHPFPQAKPPVPARMRLPPSQAKPPVPARMRLPPSQTKPPVPARIRACGCRPHRQSRLFLSAAARMRLPPHSKTTFLSRYSVRTTRYGYEAASLTFSPFDGPISVVPKQTAFRVR